MGNNVVMRGAALVLAVMTVVAVAASWLVAGRRRDDAHRLDADLALDIERGARADLGRAQARGRRLVVLDPGDAEAAAALAFATAVLATDYGLATTQEAEAALERAHGGRALSEAGAAVAAAARALIALRGGDRQGAVQQAAQAAADASGVPHPLYALGRARALAGDLVGASRALEAAMVGAPAFTAARVAWAEVRLDVGDAETARDALEAVLARAPKDTRARLLLEEAEQALDAEMPAALDGACRDLEPESAFEGAGCELAHAVRERLAGQRARALVHASAAGRLVPDEPRLLARTAEVLAQLGAVDRAAALVDRASRHAAPEMPALAWAELAVALGRGHAVPAPPRPAGPDSRLLAARAGLAFGGAGALAATLERLGRRARSRDPDLRLLARLVGGAGPAEAGGPPASEADPMRAYVEGLRARLAGDMAGAAERLERALTGHGDACRAAGEYVATLRALKRRADAAAFAPLRAENAACINLPLQR